MGEMVRFQRLPGGQLESRRKAPAAIGREKDLYRIPGVSDGDAQLIEAEFMAKLDSLAAPVLDRLLHGESISDVASRSCWSCFLLGLIHRSPRNVSAAKAAIPLIQQQMFPGLDIDMAHSEYVAVTSLPSRINNPTIGTVLNRMVWDVIDLGPAGRTLLTSDQPVIMSNGLKPPEGNYSLPISPTKLFVASWGGILRERFLRQTPRQIVSLSNRLVAERAERFVIATDQSQRHFVDKHLSKAKVPTPLEVLLDRYGSDGAFSPA